MRDATWTPCKYIAECGPLILIATEDERRSGWRWLVKRRRGDVYQIAETGSAAGEIEARRAAEKCAARLARVGLEEAS